MISAVEKELRQLKRLSDRQSIYQEQLLKQTHDQAEASLTAYTNDDGDFAEVVRARIAELNARISALRIDVDALKQLLASTISLRILNLNQMLNISQCTLSTYPISNLEKNNVNEYKNSYCHHHWGSTRCWSIKFISRYRFKQQWQ